MCLGMDCIGRVTDCSKISGAADTTKRMVVETAKAAADLSENYLDRRGMEGSPAGMVVIHEGCPHVIAASKGK